MGAPISGTFSWNTPNTATSGGTAVSADYNNLAEDVGLLYAKPWATLIMTVDHGSSTDKARMPCALADPKTSAPTSQPSATPKPLGNHCEAIFMPTG